MAQRGAGSRGRFELKLLIDMNLSPRWIEAWRTRASRPAIGARSVRCGFRPGGLPVDAAARVRPVDPRSRLQPDPRARRWPFAERGSALDASPTAVRLGNDARQGAAPTCGGDRDGSCSGCEPRPLPGSTSPPTTASLIWGHGLPEDELVVGSDSAHRPPAGVG